MTKVFIAQPIGNSKVLDLYIIGNRPIPELKDLKHHAKLYKQQGKKIATALFKSLPGGVIDALLVELLQRKASHFRVPFGE